MLLAFEGQANLYLDTGRPPAGSGGYLLTAGVSADDDADDPFTARRARESLSRARTDSSDTRTRLSVNARVGSHKPCVRCRGRVVLGHVRSGEHPGLASA